MSSREALTIGVPTFFSCLLLAYFLEIGVIVPIVDGVMKLLLGMVNYDTLPGWLQGSYTAIRTASIMAHLLPWVIVLIGLLVLGLCAIHKEVQSDYLEDM